MKFLHEIRIQAKDEKNDWRGFAIVSDSKGQMWELRTGGQLTPEFAAREAVTRFEDDEKYWDIYGYKVNVTFKEFREKTKMKKEK